MDLTIIPTIPDIYKNRNNPRTNSEIRRNSIDEGKKLLDSWLGENNMERVNKVVTLFKSDGTLKDEHKDKLTATTFNDLYKWTMMPVIRKLEKVKGNIRVTFGIDLRDETMVKAMKNPSFNQTNPLNKEIQIALKSLEERKFNRDLVKAILTGPRAEILKEEDINAFCLNKGSERSLVDIVKDFGDPVNDVDLENDNVVVSFYYRPEKSDKYGQGVHFIEATGPWHRVTWLETSLMQCVYEAKLRFDLKALSNGKGVSNGKEVSNGKGVSYGEWLYNALLRSCKSIAYTRELQAKGGPMPALFTGRRTGGLVFLLLQNLLFADHFKHDEYFNEMPASEYELPKGSIEKTKALGTSSCDSWYILKNLGLPCLNPAGTHAHEMSMVTSILYPTLDNKYPIDQSKPEGPYLPMTQVLGHYLYMNCVHDKTKGPMSMLPDTLGTPAFVLAAKSLSLGDGTDFFNRITSARQDSGSINSFKNTMKNTGYGGCIMASEIDDTVTLYHATELKYPTFGAGGFYGNSVKVWGDRKFPSNSMAVKAVRVSYTEENPDLLSELMKIIIKTPYIKITPLQKIITGYPVKIGDPEDRSKPSLDGGKLSLDKNLEGETKEKITIRAGAIRVGAWEKFKKVFQTKSDKITPILISSIDEFKPFMPQSGGRRKRKTRNMRRKKRATRSK